MSFSRARAAPHDAVHSAFLAVTAMFLFGYQMHEKTVLLPLAVLSLAYPTHSSSVLCATMAAMLSMYDLLRRDGHATTYALGMLLVAVVAYTRPATAMQRAVFAAAVCAVLAFHAAEALLPPPAKYPWMYVSNQFVAPLNNQFGGRIRKMTPTFLFHSLTHALQVPLPCCVAVLLQARRPPPRPVSARLFTRAQPVVFACVCILSGIRTHFRFHRKQGKNEVMLGSETKANGAKYFMQAPALVLAFTRALLLHPSCRTAAAAPAKEHQHPAPPQPDALARAAVVMINSAVTSSALPCSCTMLPSTLLGQSAAGLTRISVAAGATPCRELMALMSS